MRHSHRNHSRRAITLLELLVVIAIIGILVALLLPAVQQAREAARRVQCESNLKHIGLALQNYHDNIGAFPPLLVHDSTINTQTGLYSGWWSWLARILPYAEQQPLYVQLHTNNDAVLPFIQRTNKAEVSQKLSLYICPSDSYSPANWTADWGFGPLSAAHTNYLGGRGSERTGDEPGDGVFPATNISARMADMNRDGTSNTLGVGERPIDELGEWGWWALGTGFDGNGLADHVLDCSEGLRMGKPGSSADLTHFWSMHPGGAHFVFCDGRVKFLSYSIDYQTFRELGSRNGGEVPGDF